MVNARQQGENACVKDGDFRTELSRCQKPRAIEWRLKKMRIHPPPNIVAFAATSDCAGFGSYSVTWRITDG